MLLLSIIFKLLDFLSLLILIRIILSWVRVDPYHPLVKLLYNITEPVLRPLRVVIRIGYAGIDLSPIIAFFLIHLIKQLIIRIVFYNIH